MASEIFRGCWAVGLLGVYIRYLGGGFTYFLFSPLFGEDSHFDDHIFQMGGSTTN